MILRLLCVLFSSLLAAHAWNRKDHSRPQFVRRETARTAALDTSFITDAFIDAAGATRIARSATQNALAVPGVLHASLSHDIDTASHNGSFLEELDMGDADMSIIEETLADRQQRNATGEQAKELTSCDESDTNPDPVNYTEAEIIDYGEDQSDETDKTEPVKSTQQDGYFPGDSHQQWDADDIGYLDDDKHDDLEAKPTDSKEAGSLKGEAAAEALLYFDDTADELAGFKDSLVSEGESEDEDLRDIGRETRWWGRWAEREREEGRTQAEAEPDSPFHSAKPPVAARRRSQPKRATSSQETPKCMLGKYWCEQFQKAGVAIADQAKIGFKGDEWYFNAEGTKVGKGNHDKDCNQKVYFCAGQAKYGPGIKQAEAVKAAIQNHGVHPEKADCSLGKYWCKILEAAGITKKDRGSIRTKDGEWYFKDRGTKVGFGSYKEKCPSKFLCAGGRKYGMGIQQAREVKKAIENGGVHPAKVVCTLGKYWCLQLQKAGIVRNDQGRLSSRGGEWYFIEKSTGVGYGSHKASCDGNKVFCAGGKTFGLGILQARALKEAILNGGRHPDMVPCTLGKYWCPLMKRAGIRGRDIVKIEHKHGEWYFSERAVRIGYGSYKLHCDSARLFCAGGTKHGSGILQAQAVRAAIENGGIHPAKANYRSFQNFCVLANGKDAPQDGGHVTKNLEGCEATCDLKAGCGGFEWYADGWNRKNCFLFINQPLAKGSSGKQRQDAMCFIKKARHCTVFPKWRMTQLGAHVQISLGKQKYGAKIAWKTCFELCEMEKECKQVVWGKHGCFGMLARSDADQDGKGGENLGYISAHCFDKDVLHHVQKCSECAKDLCQTHRKNEKGLESAYMMGSPLHSWGCSNLWAKAFGTVRNSDTGAVYIVENPAEQVAACPFRTPHFGALSQVLCEDGTYVKDGSCMKGGHGQRLQCPADSPTMCAQRNCGSDKRDYCCSSSCDKLGGPRPCEAMAWYVNKQAIGWQKLQEKCESHGKRLCTYSELCQKKGLRPVGGLQSSSDAWCPILEDDMTTPNYVQVGATMRHPTCKKLTEDHRLDATSWPLSDERADLREVYACCQGWVGRGSRWHGRELTWRQQSSSDKLTIQGKPWHGGQVYYQRLPTYLARRFPMQGTKDVNTGNSNELFLPEAALVYLLRVDLWSGVPLAGWTNTGDVGSYLGDKYGDKVRIYWKFLDAGKHIIDNYSGMYLVSSPSLPTCVGAEGLKIPQGFVWPEKYPTKAATTIEEVWANNQRGAYGRKVQGMKFATLTLKEGEGNGGAYYLLFSNRPPSDKALPASDCSAGVSIRYGTKPKSKVRNSGEFAPTWSGTTWKVYIRVDLWQQFGSAHSKCLEETAETITEVADAAECQMQAVAKSHGYYQILRNTKGMSKCMTASTCEAPMTGAVAAWQIHAKDGPWYRHGAGSSCSISPALDYKATGHCTNGLVYSSKAWELADSRWGKKDFHTDHYKAWVKLAWAKCMMRDPGTTFVSVWTDAGYRCFKTLDCKANAASAMRTWTAVGLSKDFIHIQMAAGSAAEKILLSTVREGTKVDLYNKDDFSGRQRWVISKGSGEWYHIRALGGVNPGRTYLSVTAAGDKVDLTARDDGSGRQRWKISRGTGDWYHVTIVGGVGGKRRFLNADQRGDSVDLQVADDGSGRQRWLLAFEAGSERLTSWTEHNFNDRGNSQLQEQQTYTYRLSTGYACMLTGWTHTRTYARGFLRARAGTATATVKDLEPGGLYVWRIYQFASFGSGRNGVAVNGVPEGSTTSLPLVATAPTKSGMTEADMQGRISFAFTRLSIHVQLSGLALKRVDEITDEHLTSLEENHFNTRGDSSLDEKAVYSFVLGHGYKCDLTGWTHTRKYANGFLRNKKGEGKAIISGLEPGAEYAYKVYQYASQFAGKNELLVNGDSKGLTTSSKSAAATKTGLAQADGAGRITFAFKRTSHHVHLSGLAIGHIASGPAVVSGSSDLCKEDCLSRSSCTGFELKGGKCALFNSPIRSGAGSRASECFTLLPEILYPRRHTGFGGDNKRWRRGPGGPEGTDVGNGEAHYTAGPYEVLNVATRRLCQKSCSQSTWCVGYAFKHTKSFSAVPDWKLGTCQLVGRRIETGTKVTEVASFSKAGAWRSLGRSKCQAVPQMILKEPTGHCTQGQTYSSSAWELAAALDGPKGFASPEYSTWQSSAWRKCKRRDPKTTFVSVWKDAGYRCYNSATCGVKADVNSRSWSAVGLEKLSSLSEQNFNDRGQRTLNMRTAYVYKLSNGFTCTLRGWTHTRTYAKGFLRNKPGSGSALVSGLQPGEEYVWQVYQHASIFPGKNAVRINGWDEGLSSQTKSDEPTMLGMTKADSKGQVVFSFTRNARHVHLSGLAMRKLNEAQTEPLSSLTENSFHMRRRGNRNLDRNNGYIFRLSNGYNCELKGWTQSRDYARGVLRNVVGTASAVVSGLEPGALYSWKIYQYASKFGGSNGLLVNGESVGNTVASKRTDARKTGAHRASVHGRITFEFQRRSAHVHLSGIALGKVSEAGDEHLSSLSDSNFDDRGNVNLKPAAAYVYRLSNGYSCTLRGWTHSRHYAKGFLRNREGSATAVVSGLEPGKLYAWRIYQHASAYGGRNQLRVNGGNVLWTTQSKSDVPTRTGLTKAKPSGEISFEFVRVAPHVHLSGVAIGRVREAGTPALQDVASDSLDACKRLCEKKAGCQGIQYDSQKSRCGMWSSSFESAPASSDEGLECLSWRRL